MQSDSDRVRADLDAIGMRASGSAVGLLQLLKELLDARVLGHDAVERIREAIIADVAGARPRSPTPADFEKRVRERMDHPLQLGPEAAAPVSPCTGCRWFSGFWGAGDRKSVVKGNSLSVRVDLGG